MSTASSLVKAAPFTTTLAPFSSSTGLTPFGGFDSTLLAPFAGMDTMLAPFAGMDTMMAPFAGSSLTPQLAALRTQMDSVMRHLAASTQPMMAVDVTEREGAYLVEASLPGFKRDNINVELTPAPSGGHLLTISAHRIAREISDDPARRWHRRERVESNLSRTLTLPANLDLTGVSSKLEAGVLHVNLPKLPASQVESGGVRKIAVA